MNCSIWSSKVGDFKVCDAEEINEAGIVIDWIGRELSIMDGTGRIHPSLTDCTASPTQSPGQPLSSSGAEGRL